MQRFGLSHVDSDSGDASTQTLLTISPQREVVASVVRDGFDVGCGRGRPRTKRHRARRSCSPRGRLRVMSSRAASPSSEPFVEEEHVGL